MAEGVQDRVGASRVPRGVVLGLLVALVLAGHAAWFLTVDASPTPYLPQEAAEARQVVKSSFPNATPPTVRVLLVAGQDGSVLSAEALNVLGGLRIKVSGDDRVAPALAHQDAVGSVLAVLDPHLEGGPGEWSQQEVDSALENVTRTSQGRRALSLYLDHGAQIRGAETRAAATVLVVRLDPSSPAQVRQDAQERIRTLATEARVSDLEVWVQSPEARQDAARSLPALWVPLVGTGLVTAGALATRPGVRRPARWALLWLAGAGAGLSVGWLLGHSTPASLVVAHAGAGLGLALAWAAPPNARWPVVAAALPVAALSGWAPAGLGELALVCAAAVALPGSVLALDRPAAPGRGQQAGHAQEGSPITEGQGSLGRYRGWLGAPVAVLLAASLLSLGFAGLADQARPGWTGTLPSSTDAGQAERALAEHFRGPGPASEFVIAVRGPVTESGFLASLAEVEERLARLSLAASGGEVHSVLSLARDWATDDRRTQDTDVYDAEFARLWEDSTNAQGVPVERAPEVLAALARLDPAGTRAVLVLEDPGQPAGSGATLLRQRVSLSDVVPRPNEAVEAAIQPLVPASEEVVISGTALEEDRARVTLLSATPWVVLAALLGSLLGALAWARGVPERGGVVLLGLLAAAGALVAMAGARVASLPVDPIALLAPGLAAGAVLGLGGAWLAGRERDLQVGDAEPGGPVGRVLAWQGRRGVVALVPLGAGALALLSAPAPTVRAAGLAFLIAWAGAALVVALGLPAALGLVPSPQSPGALLAAQQPGPGQPSQAHTACPVCERSTATGASRCHSCGRWNLVEACPAHPSALEATCGSCGARLETPHFA